MLVRGILKWLHYLIILNLLKYKYHLWLCGLIARGGQPSASPQTDEHVADSVHTQRVEYSGSWVKEFRDSSHNGTVPVQVSNNKQQQDDELWCDFTGSDV